MKKLEEENKLHKTEQIKHNVGKCYRCQDELESGCKNCTLKVNEIDKTEKLVCTNCYNDYILSNHSHCIHFNSYVEKIPYCFYQRDQLLKYIIGDNSTMMNMPREDENEFGLDDTPIKWK